mmetsp:Transcript_24855/g.54116  ORF Transcript_24855/g.54116 Transcript_24855/m.54116 type:complete len:140 (-) Transcript_24855:1177-1596(-)
MWRLPSPTSRFDVPSHQHSWNSLQILKLNPSDGTCQPAANDTMSVQYTPLKFLHASAHEAFLHMCGSTPPPGTTSGADLQAPRPLCNNDVYVACPYPTQPLLGPITISTYVDVHSEFNAKLPPQLVLLRKPPAGTSCVY